MKILVFTSLYPNNIWPHHGVFVKERMTHVAKLDGCQVKVVAPVPYFPPFKINHRWCFSQVHRHEVRDGLEVYHPRYLMIPKVGMALYGLQMFLSVLPTVKKIQKKFAFDLIDAHYIYPDGFAAILLGRALSKPVVVSARGSDIHLYAQLPLIRELLQYTLHRSDKVIAVCLALKEAIMQLGIPSEKISVIPNGVDLEKFHPLPKEDARRKLALPNDKKIILSVGRLIPEKGFDLLIKAVKILVEGHGKENLHLVIAGEGRYRKELERLVFSLHLEEHVYLPGPIPHQELHCWYSAADLFCLASDREGWPNVLLEALACETPVVATAVWGVPEIIRSDNVGLLTKRNEREIAAAISQALHKPWQAIGLRRYASGHTWNQVALSVLHTLESTLAHRNNRSHDDLIPQKAGFTPSVHE